MIQASGNRPGAYFFPVSGTGKGSPVHRRGNGMKTPNGRDSINVQWRHISMIWFVLFISMGIAAAMVYLIGKGLFPPWPRSPHVFIRTGLYGLSIIQFIGMITLRRRLMMRIEEAYDAHDAAAQMDRARLLLSKYKNVILVCGGLSESFFLYGTVLYFLSGDENSYVILLTLSVLAFYLSRPRLNEIKRIFSTV
jgi:hypothetical protein